MKKSRILFSLILGMITFVGFTNPVFAKTAYIHYNNSDAYRYPTYSDALSYLQNMGYTVYGYNNAGNANAFSQMQNPVGPLVFVVHNHGSAGRQYMDISGSSIVGTNGNGATLKAVSTLISLSLNRLRIAIFYGCSTGVTTSSYGDLPGQVVAKGAQAAVAWTVSTYVSSVNIWNRLFFEKTQTDSIVEGFRHADYWLEQIEGTTRANIMKNNRNEKGNIYSFINI